LKMEENLLNKTKTEKVIHTYFYSNFFSNVQKSHFRGCIHYGVSVCLYHCDGQWLGAQHFVGPVFVFTRTGFMAGLYRIALR
jgi:hypothetical protein